jgi:hypothetical protein
MKNSILLYLLILYVSPSLAQNFEWIKRMGGTGSERSHSIAVDPNGNVYTTGAFSGTADFDPGPGTHNLTSLGGDDIFISKLDAAGKFLWAIRLGSTDWDQASDMVLDSYGNIVVVGGFRKTVDFDPGSDTFNLTEAGGQDIFVAKYSPKGALIFAKHMGGVDAEHVWNVEIDHSGNLILAGHFWGTADFDPSTATYTRTSKGFWDLFITKLDSSGAFIWVKSMGGTNADYCYAMTLDDNDRILISGSYSGTVDFDPNGGTTNYIAAGTDVYICKYDPSGNFLWVSRAGGSGYDSGNGMVTNSSGDVYITGSFQETATFDPGNPTASITSKGSSDLFLMKLTSSGKYVWAKTFGSLKGDYGAAVVLDENENIYLTGSFSDSLDFDPDSGVTTLKSAGQTDICLLKYTSKMALVWAKGFGGSNNDFGIALTADKSKNLFATGYFQGLMYIRSGYATYSLTSAGNNDAFVCKTGHCDLKDVITSQPQSQSALVGQNIRFVIAAPGVTRFQWQADSAGAGFRDLIDSGQYSGVFNDTLNISDISLANFKQHFRCIFYYDVCMDTSQSVHLWNCDPSMFVKKQPADVLVDDTVKAQFVVAVSNAKSLQWQCDSAGTGFRNLSNGGQFSGVNNDTLTIHNISGINYKQTFRCLFSVDSCSGVSNVVKLRNCVLQDYIVTQPANSRVKVMGDTWFVFKAENSASYQWQANTGSGFENLSDSGQYSGVTTDTLRIFSIGQANNGQLFRCLFAVTGCPDTDTSTQAILTVDTNQNNTHSSSRSGYLKLFPNPASTQLHITGYDCTRPANYAIMDIFGRILLGGSTKDCSTQIELNGISHGMYFFKIGNEPVMPFWVLRD